jgi:hypothetical protein
MVETRVSLLDINEATKKEKQVFGNMGEIQIYFE